MDQFWKACPALKKNLFELSRKDYYCLKVQKEQVYTLITTDKAFIKCLEEADNAFDIWKEKTMLVLMGLSNSIETKALIKEISEELLLVFMDIPIVDQYDLYEVLLGYWIETMYSDIYMFLKESQSKNENIDKKIVMRTMFLTKKLI